MTFRFINWFVPVILLFIAISVHAGEKTYIKQDVLRSDRYLIVDSKGNIKGTLKHDSLDSRRIQITDKNGKQTGYIQKDILQPSRKKYGVYNSKGKREATIQQDILQPQKRHQITTNEDNQTKIIRKDVLNQDRWVIEH